MIHDLEPGRTSALTLPIQGEKTLLDTICPLGYDRPGIGRSSLGKGDFVRAGIVYFSGTGNTWHVARRYVQAILERGKQAELLRLEEVMRKGDYASLEGYDLLGIGYPTHAWNAPRLVADFLKRLPRSKGQPVFLFVTAGSTVGGAFDWARGLLTARGYAVLHEARYYVGNDLGLAACTGRAVDGEIGKRFAWLDMDVRETVAEILAGTERHVYTSGALNFLSNLLWRFYLLGCGQVHRYFRVGDACDLCGLCAQACPTGNIQLAEDRIAFGRACTLCLRCLNLCPRRAIRLAWLTRGMERYLAPGYEEIVRELAVCAEGHGGFHGHPNELCSSKS